MQFCFKSEYKRLKQINLHCFLDFGVPLITEAKPTPLKAKIDDGKTKIAIANTVKVQKKISYPMQLEEYQNKENENPQKDNNAVVTKDVREPGFYSSEEDALYAQVNVRLEPEGQSRDTEEESERGLTTPNEILLKPKSNLLETKSTETEYSVPKNIPISNRHVTSISNINQLDKPDSTEELYAAINKVRLNSKKSSSEFPVPDEVWNVSDVKKTLQKVMPKSFIIHLFVRTFKFILLKKFRFQITFEMLIVRFCLFYVIN